MPEPENIIFEVRRNIKIYQIDTTFYEFSGYAQNRNNQIIQHIVNAHRSKTNNEARINDPLPTMSLGELELQVYVFPQFERDSIWKDFLPSQIIREEDFSITSVSFVLFTITKSNIFAIVGGNGVFVIKRYINHFFGLDFFEKIADPVNDIVVSLESRGIVGNLAAEKSTYREGQRLSDSLSFNQIPYRIIIQLRDVLIADVFDFLQFDTDDSIYAELSSSFYIKSKMSFDETCQLVVRMDDILNTQEGVALSRFAKINDKNLIDSQLRLALYVRVRDDMVRMMTQSPDYHSTRFDLDFLHPSKLNQFYECNGYQMYERGARDPFWETTDRKTLYKAGLEYIYNNVDPNNQFEFNGMISGIRVYGYLDGHRKTHAMFVDHLTCEIAFGGRPVFHIDSKWYHVKGDFISEINASCLSMLQANLMEEDILDLPWDTNSEDEGEYNLKYANRGNYLVLDKMLGQNIELCDILYETDSQIFLIHVKAGFDAKIRDLSNQILVSANRLWNDIKSGSFEFLGQVCNRYNESGISEEPLLLEDFKSKFDKDIIYVMAFCSQLSGGRSVVDNLYSVRSNIAKFTTIQIVRDMQSGNYPLRIIEISR